MDDWKALDPQPPFLTISGVSNVRDLGAYTSSVSSNAKTLSGYTFRSAEMTGITERGKEELKYQGIAKVFDLRSDVEIEKYEVPLPSVDGVEIVHTPVFKTEDYSPEAMARKRNQLYTSGKTEAFLELYFQILDISWLHCCLKTARRQRALESHDHGTDLKATSSHIEQRCSLEPVCRCETMLAFLAVLHDRYGGAEGYAKVVLGLSDDDLVIIRRNLLVHPL
ncbi:tyrosine phosphatase family-domain-containing protein [Mycena floridula]|nr:tyrosine phosphatase family-domain-containing protein [Mycena floridula]